MYLGILYLAIGLLICYMAKKSVGPDVESTWKLHVMFAIGWPAILAVKIFMDLKDYWKYWREGDDG